MTQAQTNHTPKAPKGSGKVPGAGLHSIASTGKRYGLSTGKTPLNIPAYAPHCASTTPTGYTCPELSQPPARAGACDAFKLPSRSAFTKG